MPAPAPAHTTVGRLLFEDAVPEQFRKDLLSDQPVETKAVRKILQSVADNEPDSYRRISHDLLQLGSRAAVQTESSLTLADLESPIDRNKVRADVEKQEDSIFARKDLDDKGKERELISLYGRLSNEAPETIFKAAHARGSNLAKMVASGARGSKGQLNSNVGADWLILDAQDQPVPVPIKHSYSEGLDPAEYWAQSYGTRSGLISVKFATADSGFVSKQLASAAGDLVVTKDDCGTSRGIPVPVDDPENIGTVLARQVGSFAPGTPLTARTLKSLKDEGVGNIVVRSPITCQADNGLCAQCSGIRERGILPPMMDNVGLAAASAVGEPLSQGMLSKKHSGGVASATKRTGGFKALNALLQVPEVYPDGAPVSPEDGVVTKIEKAPQGGHFVFVNEQRHYAPASQGLVVKAGDKLEAGDALTDGVINPADMVKHRGIGEGRMYFLQAMRDSFKESGLPDNRRNLEVLARAVINHSTITDNEGMDDWLPDETVQHEAIERSYRPHAETKMLQPSKAHGQYLQRPSLYYSIGTRVTPRVSKMLEDYGEKEVHVAPIKPSFAPSMVRLMEQGSFRDDVADQLSTSYVRKNLVDSVLSGKATSDLHGTSANMPLAYGLEFGRPSKGRVGY